jgi:hypothetical protein
MITELGLPFFPLRSRHILPFRYQSLKVCL